MLLPDIFNNENSQRIDYLCCIYLLVECSKQGKNDLWLVTDIFFLVTGLVANAALLWLLFKEMRKLSAS